MHKPSSFWQFPGLFGVLRKRRCPSQPSPRRLRCEQLETRNLLAADGWYNVELPTDVNADGITTPVDALLIANMIYANDGQSVTLPGENSGSVYLDVDNDGQVGVADFTAVANEIGGGSGGDAGAGNALQSNEAASAGGSTGTGTSATMASMSSSGSSSGGGGAGGGGGSASASSESFTVEVDSPSIEEGSGDLVFTIKLNHDVPIGAIIHYTTNAGSGNGAATESQSYAVNSTFSPPYDYRREEGSVTLVNAGDTATVTVKVWQDVWVEVNETMTLAIDSVTTGPAPGDYYVSHEYDAENSTPIGTGTIENDDTALVKLLPFENLNAKEGSTVGVGAPQFNRSFYAQLDNPVDAVVVVNMAVIAGTANGSDYSIPPDQVIQFEVGDNFSNKFHVNILGDHIIELNEDYTVSIASVSVGGGRDVRLDPNPANVSIVDTIENDDRGKINLVAVWSAERNETAPDALENQWTIARTLSGLPDTIQFEIHLEHEDQVPYDDLAIDVPVTVNWQTVDGSAISGGTGPGSGDYTGGSGTISGSTPVFGILPVSVAGDLVAEPDQWFKVELVGSIEYEPGVTPRSVALGTTSLTAWIRGDDYASVNIGGGGVMIVEGDSGFIDTNFNVTLAGLIDRAISVSVVDAPGNGAGGAHATPGTNDDYILMPGSSPVNFTPTGAATQAVTVRVYGDTDDEPDEFFRLFLTGLTDNGLAPFVGINSAADYIWGGIKNDD